MSLAFGIRSFASASLLLALVAPHALSGGTPSVTLKLDILPGACPNPFKVGQSGVLPVSLLGSTSIDVTQIDVASVRLCATPCPGVPVAPSLLSYSYLDTSSPFTGAACGCNTSGGDGLVDLRLKFDRTAVENALNLAALPNNSFVTVEVTGNLLNGNLFIASDCIKLVKSNSNNDCDGDGVSDNQELDCNLDGTPDDCQLFADCNHDGVPDTCQLAGNDCNQNGVPDDCDPDCNHDGIPDACQMLADCNHDGTADVCQSLADCNANGTPDVCEIAANPNLDRARGGANPGCQPNGVLDSCEGLADCNSDLIPDVCQTDCDFDGLPDACELDLNNNGTPDDCETADEASPLAEAGSLILFPEYNSLTPGTVSVLTVTNTNPSVMSGSVRVEWVYIASTCLEFNRSDDLTARDTLTVISNVHNPTLTRGFVYAFARKPSTLQPISFNFLVGDSIQLDGINSFAYSLAAIPFKGMPAPGTITDLDADGIRDLDGLEYARCWDRVIIPRFLGQEDDNFQGDDLILVALSGGAAFSTIIDVLIWNDNEDLFSSNFEFSCWAKPKLTDVSQVCKESFLDFVGNDPDEIFGAPGRESGWLEVDGLVANSSTTIIGDPAVLAVLIETSGASKVASLPFGVGRQDNGDLYPHGASGDP